MNRLLLLAAMACSAITVDAATLIHAGRVIDAVGDKVLTERTIVVDGGKITGIERGYRAAAITRSTTSDWMRRTWPSTASCMRSALC